MKILNIVVLLAGFAIAADIVLQAKRIHHTKSSRDLSLIGLTIRYVAILVILAKLISIHDAVLITGQTLIALTFTVYVTLAYVYAKRSKS
jgi:hypothetical protein